MKRSEMIELIAKRLNPIGVATDTCEEVLKIIEDAGMLPPARYRYHDWNERGITYAQWIQEPSEVNEWSKEDE